MINKCLIFFLVIVFGGVPKEVYAYDFESGGIYYNIDGDNVSVTSGDSKYQGDIVIPSQVTNNGITYSVTSIGDDAFNGCNGLTSVIIPDGVTSIGRNALRNCGGLTSITIPRSVTSIGSSAFSGTPWFNNLPNGLVYVGKVAYKYKGDMPNNTSIIIEDGTVAIADNAFSGCSGLTSVTIPNSVTSIGAWAFEDCSNLTSVTIPDGVTSIVRSTFSGCSGLTSVTIPSSVTHIGVYAFSGCSGLTSITIPSSVTSIGDSAFWGFRGIFIIQDLAAWCKMSVDWFLVDATPRLYVNGEKLEHLVIPSSVDFIGKGAFSGFSLTSVTIPNSVTSIGNSAFFSCSGLTSVTIPSSVTFIGSSAFSGCRDLTSVTIPSSVTSIGNGAFSDTPWFNNQPNGLVYAGKVAFKYKGDMPNNTSIIIEDGTVEIAGSAFSGCSGLTSITIPNCVTSIGGYAFDNCSGLTSVTIPNSVTSIEFSAFENCSGLTNVISEIEKPFEIASSVFEGIPSYTELTVPKGTKAAYLATKGWNKFTKITEAEDSEFYVDGIYYIMGENNTVSVTSGEVKYSGDVVIPSQVTYNGYLYTVTSIGNDAFQRSPNLTSVTIPNSVTIIGEDVFYDCKALTSVNIPNGVTSIGRDAFMICTSLTSITIPNSVTSIGGGAFSGCSGLTTVISEIEKPFEIASSVFEGIPSYTELTVPKGTKATYQATEGWNKFTKITESTNGGDGMKVELEALSYSREYGEANPVFDYKVNIKEGEQFLWNGSETYGESWNLRNIDITTGIRMFNSGDRLRFYATNIGVNAWMTVVIDDTKPYLVDGAFQTDESSYLEVVLDEEKASQLNSHISGGKLTFQIQGRSFTLESISKCMSFELNGEPTISCEASASSPVGTYPIKISKGSITNDNVTYVDGTLTITKAPLTITAKNCSKEQGQENPAFEVTYSGFKNGENESVLNRKPTVSTTATASSPSGTYDIEVSGAEAQNYSFIYNKGVLTVTEKEKVAFTIDGTAYQGSKSEKTVMVKSVDTSRTWMEIPASVSYDGRTYQVTGIDNDVFKGGSMAALIWSVEAVLPNNTFSNASIGSNFLLYVKSSSYAPSSVKNVVVNGTAQTIVLSDDGGQFYCPQAFTARSISYTHNYSMETDIGKAKGWETLALPFDVQKISHNTRGEIVPFPSYNSSSTQKPFWLANFSGSGFRRTAAVLANEPYIIAMPNSSNYRNEYNLAGDVTFSADNVQVPKTPSFSGTFVPAFGTVPQSSTVYALNVNNRNVRYSGSYDAGSRFIANLRDVRPFEAYISNSSTRGIIEISFDDGTTDMLDILLPTDESQEVTIHTLSGQQITRISQRDFDAVWQQLPKGVYIINGKKRIK